MVSKKIFVYKKMYNNYSMSPSWIWSDKVTNERVARVGYNHFISNKSKWNNCFSKFSNRGLPPIFISTILQSVRKENLAHYFPYDVKLGLLAHSRSCLANQKARNAIVGAENLLKGNIPNHNKDIVIFCPIRYMTKTIRDLADVIFPLSPAVANFPFPTITSGCTRLILPRSKTACTFDNEFWLAYRIDWHCILLCYALLYGFMKIIWNPH